MWDSEHAATLRLVDFNHHLIYATKGTSSPIYLLAADGLRPVLALAGVTLPEPT